jgi:hypothetical protein
MDYTFVPLARLFDKIMWEIDCCTVIPTRYVVNFQKCGTLFFCLFMMWYYQNFSLGAWTYTGLHGSYGLLWFFKDLTFPDE